jgi:hypothetical protein
MKKDKQGMTDYLTLPADEAERVLEALKQAESTNDIEALKWCARKLCWLDDTAEIESADDQNYPEHLFNKAWAKLLKNDPVPASIADIIARIDEDEPKPPTAEDAGNALETVRAFFQENVGGKSFKAVCVSLDALRGALIKAEAA